MVGGIHQEFGEQGPPGRTNRIGKPYGFNMTVVYTLSSDVPMRWKYLIRVENRNRTDFYVRRRRN